MQGLRSGPTFVEVGVPRVVPDSYADSCHYPVLVCIVRTTSIGV
jgi:hypothetical protein